MAKRRRSRATTAYRWKPYERRSSAASPRSRPPMALTAKRCCGAARHWQNSRRRSPRSTWRSGISTAGVPASRCGGSSAAPAYPESRSTRRSVPSAPRMLRWSPRPAAAAGFDCVKVKVGNSEDELTAGGRPRRDRRPGTIRVDANGAWSVPRAVETLAALARSRTRAVRGAGSRARCASTPSAATAGVPIAADESAREPGVVLAARLRRGLPEARAVRRDQRLVRDAAAARRRIRGLHLLDARRPARDRSGAARERGGRARPSLWSGDAGRFDRPDPMPACDGIDVPARRRRVGRRPHGLVWPLSMRGSASDDLRRRRRVLQMRRVAGVRDYRDAGGRDPRPHPLGDHDELRIALAGQRA